MGITETAGYCNESERQENISKEMKGKIKKICKYCCLYELCNRTGILPTISSPKLFH